MDKKFITVLGYGWTGSSAVIDLLAEYNGMKVFGDHEFRLIKDPGGIIDLEAKITNNWSVLNSNYYIYEFNNLILRYAKRRKKLSKHNYEYDIKFNIELEDVCKKFIESLISEEWNGYSFLYERKYGSYEFFIEKIKRKIGLSNQEDNQVVFLKRDLNYREKVRVFTSSLHQALADNPTQTVVLNQALPVCNPATYHDYFDNAKSIVINRDPRDIFTYSHRFSWMPRDPKIFVKWYREQMLFADQQQEFEKGQVLRLNFEDLVLHYDESVDKIEDFLQLKSGTHITNKEIFNPEISIKNIGLWKQYDKKITDYLATELKEYLYN